MTNADLYSKIPASLKIAAKLGLATRLPNFQIFVKDLLVNRIDLLSDILKKLEIKPESFQVEMFGDISSIAADYITQGKTDKAIQVVQVLKLNKEICRNILLNALHDVAINIDGIKNFTNNGLTGLKISDLKNDDEIKTLVKSLVEDLENSKYSVGGKDNKKEAETLGIFFGVRQPKKIENKFGDFGSKYGSSAFGKGFGDLGDDLSDDLI
jgi:hypothetical protein